MKIGYLDDHIQRAEYICTSLKSQGINVWHFTAPQNLITALTCNRVDLLLINIKNEEKGPDSALNKALEHFKSVPKLLIVSNNEFAIGCMSLTKNQISVLPHFSCSEKLLRGVRHWLARNGLVEPQPSVKLGHVTLDQKRGRITVDGRIVKMTPKDIQVATCLMNNVGKTLSRPFLLREVWGINVALNTRTVDVHVSRVRKALQLIPERGYSVKTVYQQGYCLDQVKGS